ncbi:MAG: DUF1080 domain-containing protein [Opitutales bacterium]|nr:DUF1080 domain-containing protein [Opitutales bacterium]
MKFPTILIPTLLLLIAGCSQNKDSLDSIFNGQDLSGWHYKTVACWQVEDGILHAINDPEQKGDILQTAKSYKNFGFQADFKFGGGRATKTVRQDLYISQQYGEIVIIPVRCSTRCRD